MLVSGGASGIGARMVDVFAAQVANVALLDRGAAGGNALSARADSAIPFATLRAPDNVCTAEVGRQSA